MALWLRQANAQRIQGVTLMDADGVNWFLADVVQENERNYAMQRVQTGAYVVTHRLRTWAQRRGPSGIWQHTWKHAISHADETVYLLVQRIGMRPVPINMHTSITDMEFFDGDGTATEFYTWRPLLGASYAQSGSTGLGVNAGTSASSWTVYNAGTGATVTTVYGRTITVLDFAGAVADTVSLSITDDDAVTTVHTLTGVAGAPGADQFQCVTDNDTTAENLKLLIDGKAGVSATRSGAIVTLTPDATTITLTHSTSDASDLEYHPSATEVALDLTGTYAWRRLKFGAAPSNMQGGVRVEGHFLYRVCFDPGAHDFAAPRDATANVGLTMVLTEIGGGN